ncbi:MAG: ribosome small subunit-dependent GTPase A [Eubacterium sp.]|jgi:ribosome biogenesis GTPase
MMEGKIIKGIAGFYYVYVAESGIYECKAKGIFRKNNLKPLVGDNCSIEVIDESDRQGNIVQIHPRKNSLIRPAIANIDQAVVIFAAVYPKPHLNLVDRLLVTMEKQKIPSLIVFNKKDLAEEEELDRLKEAYRTAGYPLIFTSTVTGEGMDELMQNLRGKTSAVAGPSGVGKSSIINWLSPDVQMETGAVSEKIARGRHTTRHAQLIYLADHTYIADTPGFTSFGIDSFEKEEIGELFPEFAPYEKYCRFSGCSHISEPVCGVRDAVAQGEISRSRYDSYCEFYRELKGKKKY